MDRIFTRLTDDRNAAGAQKLAQLYDVPEDKARIAMTETVGELSYAMERNTLSRGGLADLIAAIGDRHHETYLDDPDALKTKTAKADGIAILDHVLGSKHQSRVIAGRAAKSAGLESSQVEAMLPAIAAMMMGALSKEAGQPLRDLMRQFGMGQTDQPTFSGQANQPVRSNQAGSVGQHEPLPIPGDNLPGLGRRSDDRRNPLDEFSDTLRRGKVNAPSGGGSLWQIARSLIGSILGFRSSGVLGWILRFLVVRYGGRILQMLLRIFVR